MSETTRDVVEVVIVVILHQSESLKASEEKELGGLKNEGKIHLESRYLRAKPSSEETQSKIWAVLRRST